MSVETYNVVLKHEAYEAIDSNEGWFDEEITRFFSKAAAQRTFDRLNRMADDELEMTEDIDNEGIDAAIVIAR